MFHSYSAAICDKCSSSDAVLRITSVEQMNKTISIEQFSTIKEAIDYCRDNRVKLLVGDLLLTENTSFLGVYLELAGNLYLNGFDVEFGGGGVQTTEVSQMGYDLPQFINSIIRKTGTESVYVRGCQGIRLTINYCLPIIKFRLNNTYPYIAYSEFNLKTVGGIDIDNDPGANTGELLWFNENVLNLMRCGSFRMDGSYSHNNNRIYGGCFEGVGQLITFNRGHKNTLYDMRFEVPSGSTGTIYMGEETQENVLFTSYRTPNIYNYGLQITDLGLKNSVRDNLFATAHKVYSGLCSNLAIDGHFRCASTVDNFIVPSNVAQDRTDRKKILFESDYFSNPLGLCFVAEVDIKTGNGIRAGYNVYDADFNLITDLPIVSFYHLDGVYKDSGGIGYSVVRNDSWEYADVVNGLKLVQFLPQANFTTSDPSRRVKYVKFFLYTTTDVTNVFGKIAVNIYDTTRSN